MAVDEADRVHLFQKSAFVIAWASFLLVIFMIF